MKRLVTMGWGVLWWTLAWLLFTGVPALVICLAAVLISQACLSRILSQAN